MNQISSLKLYPYCSQISYLKSVLERNFDELITAKDKLNDMEWYIKSSFKNTVETVMKLF